MRVSRSLAVAVAYVVTAATDAAAIVAAAIAVAASLGLLLLSGCSSHETVAPQPGPSGTDTYAPQDSPAHCLQNLRTAYLHRELTAYEALFSDDYKFILNPDDVANMPVPIIFQLSRAGEDSSASRAFRSPETVMVGLSFASDPAVRSDSAFAGTWRVRLTDANLVLYALYDSPHFFRVENGTATLYFKEYPSESAGNGQPLWRIWRWEDHPGVPAVESHGGSLSTTSWGLIKLLFE